MATVRETGYRLLRQNGLTTIFGNPGNAKVVRCCVECGYSPETLRTDSAGRGLDLTQPFAKGYKKLSLKSSGPVTQAR